MTASRSNPDPIAEDVSEISQTLADFQSYPVLTRDIGQSNGPRPAGGGQAAYGQVVHAALQEVLGWRPRPGDAKGLTAALNQSFHAKESQGHTVFTWSPRTYSIEVDLGAVTGAQAAIYARAKLALDHSLPLLEGLTPLRGDSDDEDIDAMQAVVRSGLMELVHELGLEGGPRLFRVDELFGLLLGQNKQLPDPERVGGQLGLLRERFGLQRQRVNTIEEERNLTNFLILVDNVNSLRQTWESQKQFFNRDSSDVFFGTQMVQLSRALAVVAESVQETYSVMDSVFLGAAERQVTELRLKDVTVYLAEFLSRIESFSTDEGPQLIREGGKDGLIHAFRPTAIRLQTLAREAADLSKRETQNPTGLGTPRVQRLLDEVATHLCTVVRLSSKVSRLPGPFPRSVTPSIVVADPQVPLIIEGARFQQGDTVKAVLSFDPARSIPIGKTAEGVNVEVVDDSIIQATFDLSGAPAASLWDMVVVSQEGVEGILRGAFSIDTPPGTAPSISSLDPPESQRGSLINVSIKGTGFRQGAQVDFGSDIEVLFIRVPSEAEIIAGISIAATAAPGVREVKVTNPDATPNGLFEVLSEPLPPPDITSISQTEAAPGQPALSASIIGTGFRRGVEVIIGNEDDDGISATVEDVSLNGQEIKVKIVIDKDAAPGRYNVIVRNPDGQDDTLPERPDLPGGFTVIGGAG